MKFIHITEQSIIRRREQVRHTGFYIKVYMCTRFLEEDRVVVIKELVQQIFSVYIYIFFHTETIDKSHGIFHIDFILFILTSTHANTEKKSITWCKTKT